MTAPTYDVTIEQGATFTKAVAIEGLNLAGAAARMQARRNYAGDAVIDIDSEGKGGIAITVTDTSHATLDITITAPQAAGVTTHLRYDLEVELADGTVYRLLQGKMTLSKEITR